MAERQEQGVKETERRGEIVFITTKKSDPEAYWPLDHDRDIHIINISIMAVVISLIITVIIVICVLNHRGIMCPVSNSSSDSLNRQRTNHKRPFPSTLLHITVHQCVCCGVCARTSFLTLNYFPNYTWLFS